MPLGLPAPLCSNRRRTTITDYTDLIDAIDLIISNPERDDLARTYQAIATILNAIADGKLVIHSDDVLDVENKRTNKLKKARNRIKKLEKALRPFADCKKYIWDEYEDDPDYCPNWSPFLEIKHYMLAHEILKDTPNDKP